MREYLLVVIGTVLLCSMITAIMPEGKTTGVVRGVAKMACVLAIISPIFKFFKTGNIAEITDKNSQDFFEQTVIEVDGEFIKYYSEMRIRATEESLEQELFRRYEVETSVEIDWIMDEEWIDGRYSTDVIKILSICVDVSEETGEEIKNKMWEYLTNNYCSEVLIE